MEKAPVKNRRLLLKRFTGEEGSQFLNDRGEGDGFVIDAVNFAIWCDQDIGGNRGKPVSVVGSGSMVAQHRKMKTGFLDKLVYPVGIGFAPGDMDRKKGDLVRF